MGRVVAGARGWDGFLSIKGLATKGLAVTERLTRAAERLTSGGVT